MAKKTTNSPKTAAKIDASDYINELDWMLSETGESNTLANIRDDLQVWLGEVETLLEECFEVTEDTTLGEITWEGHYEKRKALQRAERAAELAASKPPRAKPTRKTLSVTQLARMSSEEIRAHGEQSAALVRPEQAETLRKIKAAKSVVDIATALGGNWKILKTFLVASLTKGQAA